MFVTAMFEMVGLGVLLPLLQALANGIENSNLNRVFDWLNGQGWDLPDNRMFLILGIILAVYLIKNLVLLVTIYLQTSTTLIQHARISSRMLRAYLGMDLKFFARRNSGDILRNLETSSFQVFETGLLSILNIVLESLIISGIMIYLFWLNTTIILSVGGILGAGFLIYNLSIQHRVQAWGQEYHDAMSRIYQWINQSIGSFKETKVLGRENFFTQQYAMAVERRAYLRTVLAVAQQSPRLLFETLIAVALIVVVAIITSMGTTNVGPSTLPLLGMFAFAAFRLLPSMNKLVNSMVNLRSTMAPMNHLYAEMREIGVTFSGGEFDYSEERVEFKNKIELKGIGYKYENLSVEALKDITLDISFGESIGIAGASGAGKSTLVDILLGLLSPSEGRIILDGKETNLKPGSWMGQVGFIPQSTFLIDDSIRRNIAFGMPDTDIKDDKVNAAMEKAGLGPLISELPDGLDTVVGDRGIRLSGGQRQRIAIARALYLEPSLLLLDEATSALDNQAESGITTILDELGQQLTIIIIAHRLSTIHHCDKIVFMANGRIVDVGTFDELYERCDGFREQVDVVKLK